MKDHDLSKIHIARWGDSGPLVIMIHGGAQGSSLGGERNFYNQRALTNTGWQLIVPDRPGHGQSPSQGWPDDAAMDGAWVADLIGGGAHLVGHSFGGCVTLNAASRRPDLVRSLTLIEPGMHRLAINETSVKRFIFRLMIAATFSMSSVNRTRKIMKIIGIPPEIRSADDHAELARMGDAFKRGRMPTKADLERELTVVRQAGVPLLVVSGGWSPAFDITAARVAEIGAGKHVIIKSPHHFPQIVSDEFTGLLNDFMKGASATMRHSG